MNQMTPAEELRKELSTEGIPGETISYEDFLKLQGLLTLAIEHNRSLKSIEKAAAQITGATEDGYDYYGCTSDAVYELVGSPSSNAQSLLNKLGIEVVSGEES